MGGLGPSGGYSSVESWDNVTKAWLGERCNGTELKC